MKMKAIKTRSLFMRLTRTHTDKNGCSYGKSVFWINHFEKWLLLFELIGSRSHAHTHTQGRTKLLKAWKYKDDEWQVVWWKIGTTLAYLLVAGDDRQRHSKRAKRSCTHKNPMKLRTIRASFITHLQTTILTIYSNIPSLRPVNTYENTRAQREKKNSN